MRIILVFSSLLIQLLPYSDSFIHRISSRLFHLHKSSITYKSSKFMLNDDKNDEINIGMNNEDDESIQSLISDKSVKLLGLTADDVEASGPLIFKERESNVERFEFPMMPFPNPLFYQSRDFLYIYEMRFRTLMNDVESIYSNSLGRIFVTDEGAVGKIGTVCSVVQKRRLQDGKGFFIIEATFLKGLPSI